MSRTEIDIIHVDDDQSIREAVEATFPDLTYKGAGDFMGYMDLLSQHEPTQALIIDGFFPGAQTTPACIEALQYQSVLPIPRTVARIILTGDPKHEIIGDPDFQSGFRASVIGKFEPGSHGATPRNFPADIRRIISEHQALKE